MEVCYIVRRRRRNAADPVVHALSGSTLDTEDELPAVRWALFGIEYLHNRYCKSYRVSGQHPVATLLA